jgi:tRNA threonylcarbamoyl adenosine modification protein (Sua5/YciO/YrdC/YwlC family)
MAELIKIHPDNPQENKIRQVVECLRKGGIIIYPTDTVYGIGCDLTNARAVEKVCKIKHVDPKKMHLSFICYDLSDLSLYAHKVSNHVFKVMKKALPGPFTFILESSNKVPKIVGIKKKNVGIRVPNHKIPRAIVHELGNPLVTTSLKTDDDIIEYLTDPSLMMEKFGHQVDMIVDGGLGNTIASTVVKCMDENIYLIREGLGNIEEFADVLPISEMPIEI